MAKVNYSHQKKQKELATKKKQQKKLEEKLLKNKLEEQSKPETGSAEDPAAG